MTTTWPMMAAFLGDRRSTRMPITMRSKAPASTGVPHHQALFGVTQTEILSNADAQRAEDDPDHEGQVEIEEGSQQCGRVAGLQERFFVHDAKSRVKTANGRGRRNNQRLTSLSLPRRR